MSFFIYLGIIIALGIVMHWIQQEDFEKPNLDEPKSKIVNY